MVNKKFLSLIVIAWLAPLGANEPSGIESVPVKDAQNESTIFLEYVSPRRIKDKMAASVEKISKAKLTYRCSMAATVLAGGALVGVVGYAFWRGMQPKKFEPISDDAGASDREWYEGCKRRWLKDWEDRQTFGGMVKHETKHGVTAALSAAAVVALTAALGKIMGVTWSSEWFTRTMFPTTNDLFAREAIQLAEQLQHLNETMQQYLGEVRDVNTPEKFASFKILNRFYISDVEFATKMFVYKLEDFIATVAEIARDRGMSIDETLRLFIENIDVTVNQVNGMIGFLEELINASSEKVIQEVLDKVSLTSSHGLKCSFGLMNMAKGMLREG